MTNRNSNLIFINGKFDTFHFGHFFLLIEAKKLKEQCGGRILIAIDSDEKIRKDTDNSRPYFTLEERMNNLLLFKKYGFVDDVISFDSNKSLENIIKSLEPDYMIKGSDWKGNVIGGEYCKKIIFIDRDKGSISSSKIISRIKSKL